MEKDLSSYRKSYEKGALLEHQVPKTPLMLFNRWFKEAEKHNDGSEANAMNIASIGLDGYPKNRIVLLKKITLQGFVFFTNYNSEKGKAIKNNNKVCASFFWQGLERQVIIKGQVEKLSVKESNQYFNSRPEGSKLGAWASNQSAVVKSREDLQKSLESYTLAYENKEIERPLHWGGYLIKPISIEFWQGRPNRMHDRLRYTQQENLTWEIERLAP